MASLAIVEIPETRAPLAIVPPPADCCLCKRYEWHCPCWYGGSGCCWCATSVATAKGPTQ